MLRSLLIAAVVWSVGCSVAPVENLATPRRVTADANRDIRVLLDRLYRSFNYGPGQEPDWTLMRACFVDGALFVPEPEPGKPVRPRDVDALIAGWQASMRRGTSMNPGYAEWIDSVKMARVGNLVRADVVFYGKEPGDPHARQPGLDSLQLVQVHGEWKVLSFVVQSESKL